ncbi:hypothetical protein BC831DRAFT_290796 [Entophlyctis helioformis]|nr:hypothetical protein BC831DRAFT_290796 [Entophlyctis helioformis]
MTPVTRGVCGPDMDAEDATIDLSGPFTASRVTYYGDGFQKMFDPPPIGPENGGWYGACYNVFYQNPAIIPKNFNKFAALNERQYNQVGPKTVCGTCVQLTMPRTNRTTIVQIVDMCPGCSSDYGLDISHAAMADLVGGGSDATNTDAWKNAERVGALAAVRWEAVPCSMLAESAVFDGPAGYLSPTATATSGQDRGSVRGSGSGSGSGAPAPVASSAGTPTSPGGDLTNAGPWMKPQFHFSPEPVP